MEKAYEEKYHANEDTNWWFLGRQGIINRLLKQYNVPHDARIIDVGCASGALMQHLRKQGYTRLTGVDISKTAIDRVKKRGFHDAHVMDAAAPQLPEETFDVVIASNILEHIEDEAQALSHWHTLLKPNGLLMVFVPAYQFLWSGHDIVNQHYRRYTRGQLLHGIKEAGFRVSRSSYWNFCILFPSLLIALIRRIDGKGQHTVSDALHTPPGLLNTLAWDLLSMENKLLRFINYPCGVSVLVVARKSV